MEHIHTIKNAKMYLPDVGVDSIQGCIAALQDYWDRTALDMIDKYLPDNATILDLGANIGSHSLYWALERNAKKIYAFEPFNRVYEILLKNIVLNNLQCTILPYNLGLYKEFNKARILLFWEQNLGGTTFTPDSNGVFNFIALDSLKISDKIDLVKIDVESMEIPVLEGAIKTLEQNHPVIVIEIHSDKEKVEEILFPLGYKLVETIRENEDYIYMVE